VNGLRLAAYDGFDCLLKFTKAVSGAANQASLSSSRDSSSFGSRAPKTTATNLAYGCRRGQKAMTIYHPIA
jgi:hypothetical protein